MIEIDMMNTDTLYPTFPKRLKVLFYAVNGIGLGHLTRLLAIAKKLKINFPDSDLLFITSSDADNILSKEGIPYVHLPSKTVVGQSGTLTYRKMGRLYNALVNAVYDNFQPHILVVDTMVTGSFHDLLNILRFGNCFKVFVHRARKIEAYEQSVIQAQRFYNLVIAPHYKNAEIIPMPIGFDVPLFWAGPIMLTNKENAEERESLRKRLNVTNEENLVFISLGGGGDASNEQTLLSVFNVLSNFSENIKILLAEGLLSNTTVIRQVIDKNIWLKNKIIRLSEYPVANLFNALDLAISGAGYNTFHELLYFGIPSIFIPKVRGYDDQLARAKMAESKNACLVCEEDENFEINFYSKWQELENVEKQKKLKENCLQLIPNNYADQAAKAILSELNEWYKEDLLIIEENKDDENTSK